MSDFWLRILGLDPSTIPDDATTAFFFAHPPRSWMVFVMLALLVGVVYGTVWLYRRETTSGAPMRARVWLAAVRSAVLILLLIILLGPALAINQHRDILPHVIVLVDDSASMTIRDRYADEDDAARVARFLNVDPAEVAADAPVRAELVRRLLADSDEKFLKDLARRGHVHVMKFAGDDPVAWGPVITMVSDEQAPPADAGEAPAARDTFEPRGRGTNLSRAIGVAARQKAGEPIAAIVVITDGQHNQGDNPVAAAAQAASRNIPVFTLGVGDAAEPRNIKVAQVWAPDSVFRDDPFVIEAQVEANGFGGNTVRVQLVATEAAADGSAGGEFAVDSEQVTFTGAQAERRLQFEYTPEEAGSFVFTVKVEPLAGEVLDNDNARSIPVKVLSDQARVLLVSGAPSWEYRMVATLLKRDKTVDLSCWLQTMDQDMRQEGNTVIDRLPSTPPELFEYDVVIFLDPDPAEFNEAWIEALEKFLADHAGGVMWVAGPKFTARFLTFSRTAVMRKLLPVQVGELSALDVETLVMTHPKDWPIEIAAEGADHVLMRLDKDPLANQQMWDVMPGIYWSFPVKRAKPGARVLAEHSNPRLRTRDGQRPLLVAGQYGPGRTVYMGFNGTWRWRKLGENFFDRYWVQAVRYLAEGRLLGEKKRGRISIDRDVYGIGSRVQVSAKLYDENFDPLGAEVVGAALSGPEGGEQTFELRAVPGQAGDFEGTVVATRVGLNEIVIHLAGGGEGPVRVSRQLTVEVPRVEFSDPRLNKPLLRELANKTTDQGGRYFEIDEAGALTEAIPDRSERIVVLRPPLELWDTSRPLILFLGLLTLEWALRKRLKMM